ncbi:ChaN family lipoprotein [Rhodobacteraceae bacterium D3-12]|nr:ChaN family lipoprotein [Rhodobacteraceae bacterium D3-12]
MKDREGLTPALPSPEPYRRYIFDLTGGGRKSGKATGPMDPEFYRFVRAQEVWDRAFATHMAREVKPDGPLVVGIIGQGHLQWGGGVSWQLADLGVRSAYVSVPQMQEDALFREGAADFVFRLPEREAKTEENAQVVERA